MQEERQSVMEECPNEQNYSKTKEVEIKETKNSSTKFPKLWSEEDEITLLSGYCEYRERKGKSDVGGFYEFIKHRLIRSCVKQSQVSDKICRLKKKYMDHASKSSNNLLVVDSHVEKLFELSRNIWSTDGKDSNNIADGKVCSPSSPLSPLPLPEVGVKFESSNNFLCEEFLGFLYYEGVDVHLLDNERVTDLKRKFGEVELSRSKFEYKQAKLRKKLEKLKYDHYKKALEKFF